MTEASNGMTETADSGRMTWALLLAKWTEFAKASAAAPGDAAGDRFRASTAPIIELQAVTHALAELDELDPEERPLALDKADLVCRGAASKLNELWRNEPMPEGLSELINDSRIAFEMAANAGVEWLVTSERFMAPHPAKLSEQLERAEFLGDVFWPAPGVPLFAGCPAAFARGPGGSPPTEEQCNLITDALGADVVSEPERLATPRQAYRQVDFATGQVTRDLVVPMNAPLPAGQPLLVLAIEGGDLLSVSLPPRREDRTAACPVVVEDHPSD